ncbi:MAG: glycine cleavage system aminomethyltransferase GcvT [Myxococcota bacterium]
MSDQPLLKTPLHAKHVEAGGRMVPFAGYSMPVQYSGLTDEHLAVRRAVGLFDVSHMGEVFFEGERAAEVADRIVTNNIGKQSPGQAVYSAMCRPDGGVIDDLVAYKFSDQKVMICVNAANRAKDFEWMKAQAGADCDVTDRSDEYGQIAVQGPKAAELLARLTDRDVSAIKTYRFIEGPIAGRSMIIARTGYTGEDGFELYCAAEDAADVWSALLEEGRTLGAVPAGLGARDSLRLEYCFALYGNDIDESTNPYEAGLGWVVKLKKGSGFVGRSALSRIKAEGPQRKLVPFELTGKGIARQGHAVLIDGKEVGKVTSGTKTPSVGKAIGLAYLPTQKSEEGTLFQVDIRGKPVDAVVTSRPFLKK